MQLDQEDFKQRVGRWWTYLEPFFASEKAYDIYQQIKKDAKSGEVICPISKDTWKFLEKSDPDNLKVIIIGLDSYPGRYNKTLLHATGIPFDCSNSPDGKLQPSLSELWNGISNDLGEEVDEISNLQFLLDQGVFLGNRGITCKLFKTGSHIPLWDYFWEVFFEQYVCKRPDIPIIFLGKESLKLKKYVTFNRIFELSHPSASARTGLNWDTKGVFTQVNNIIKSLNGKDYMIKWDYKQYESFLNETPF